MFELFLALLFFLSIFLNLFLFIEKQEINEEIIEYINQIKETRTRAIELLKTKFKDEKENKELIEAMKEI
jgi:predicted PurR-regulated permease PerM